MYKKNLDMPLSELLASQWGMATTAQAKRAGIARYELSRLVTRGKLRRISRGVYRSTEAPIEPREGLYAAWLSLYPEQTAEERLFAGDYDAVVSLETAADIHGLGDFVPDPYRFSVPTRKQTVSDEIKLKVKRYPSESVTICEGLPTTTIEQTVADLVEDHTDFSLISDMFTNISADVVQEIDFDRMSELLAPFAKRNGFKASDGAALRDELIRPLRRERDRVIQSYTEAIVGSGAFKPVAESTSRLARQLAEAIAQTPAWKSQMSALTDAIKVVADQVAPSIPVKSIVEALRDVPVS